MPNINIQVAAKIATNTTPGVAIVCGNNDYTVKFSFDSEWNAETNRVARFVYYKDGLRLYRDVEFTGDTVAAPILSGVDYVLVGVYAGDLRTTTPAKVLCDRSILCGDQQSDVLPPSAKLAVQAQIGDLGELQTTDKTNLVTAINETHTTVVNEVGITKDVYSLPFTWIEGKFVNLYGARPDYAGCSIAYIADMTPYVGKTLKIKTYAFGDMAYLVSDASWNRLLGEASNATADNGEWEFEITVPETAKYLQVSYSNRKNTEFQLYEAKAPLREVVDGLVAAVDALNELAEVVDELAESADELDELVEAVDELAAVVDEVGSMKDVYSLPFTWKEGKYVTIYGTNPDYAGCSIAYIADMTPFAGKTLRIKTYAFGDMAYLVSDASWNRLLGEASNATADNGEWEFEITVPENAKYLQVSYSNRKNTEFQLYEAKAPLWEVVDEIEKTVNGGIFDNPLKNVRNDAGLLSVFRRVGCIGDSLASGCCVYKDADGTEKGVDLYEFSWGQFLARMTGNTYHNFSRGGWSTKNWLNGDLGYNLAFDGNHPCDAYIIGLGQNDANQNLAVGTSADIDLNDCTNNADTYYGNYGKIIQKIQARYPKAKIFVCTDPLDKASSPENNGYNAAVREIAAMFSNVYLLDLFRYGKALYDYNGNNLLSVNKRYAHFSAVGYYECAKIIATYIDWIIKNNPTEFLEVEFINTDYSYYN